MEIIPLAVPGRYNFMKGLISYKWIAVVCMALLVISFTIGYLVMNQKTPDMVQRPDEEGKAKEQEEQQTDNTYMDYVPEPVSSSQTRLLLKTFYKGCGHTAVERQDIPEQLAGLREEELLEHYPGWEGEKFQGDEIVLFRLVEGACPGHYVLRMLSGYVAIYMTVEKGEETLVEVTDIPVSILRLKDQQRLREGIMLDSMEEVNQYLEDLGS
jgi:hypothetical protein